MYCRNDRPAYSASEEFEEIQTVNKYKADQKNNQSLGNANVYVME
jgi:hypothetical protein